jgi:hypothetical protein
MQNNYTFLVHLKVFGLVSLKVFVNYLLPFCPQFLLNSTKFQLFSFIILMSILIKSSFTKAFYFLFCKRIIFQISRLKSSTSKQLVSVFFAQFSFQFSKIIDNAEHPELLHKENFQREINFKEGSETVFGKSEAFE